MNKLVPLLSLCAIGLSGCANETPRVDAALGKSVAQMVRGQTYDPQAAANPPALVPEGSDAQRLKNAIDGHRKAVSIGTTDISRSVSFEAGK